MGVFTPVIVKLPSRSVSTVPALLEMRVRGIAMGAGGFALRSAESPGVALARTVPKTSKLWMVFSLLRTSLPVASIE